MTNTKPCAMIGHDCLQAPENIFVTTVPLIGGLHPTLTSIRIISSFRRIFDFFDSCDKCLKPGFLRGNIYTSCIYMALLDHFANKSNPFQHSLSLFRSPISSHFLLGSPLPPIPDSRIAQLKVPCSIRRPTPPIHPVNVSRITHQPRRVSNNHWS